MISLHKIKWDEGGDVLSFFESVKSKEAVLLHSALQIGEHGRYSIVGWNPNKVLSLKLKVESEVGERVTSYKSQVKSEAQKALDGLYEMWRDYQKISDFRFPIGVEDKPRGNANPGVNANPCEGEDDSNSVSSVIPAEAGIHIPYKGGPIGYFSYDFGVALEGIKQTVKSDYSIPDLYFIIPSKFVVFDHKKKEIFIGVMGENERQIKNDLDEIKLLLNRSKSFAQSLCKSPKNPVDIRSNVSYEEYSKNIKLIKQYLENGDTYQVNYSQRFSASFSQDPWCAFKKFTEINPSPFQCYFEFENVKIVSNSPERLICGKLVQNSLQIESRPIKGTVPRGANKEEEKSLGDKLLKSEKDKAELIMIVDLVRNDLGKVCEIGTVEVNEKRVLEKYSHVQHTMSNVRGILKKEYTWKDVIKAVFPGGSVTGCPKYRTIQIIDELEEFKRGLYCGSAGYISFDGQFDFNIMIRTLGIINEKVYFNSGGGIVYDSTPESEYDETLDKAAALIKSIS